MQTHQRHILHSHAAFFLYIFSISPSLYRPLHAACIWCQFFFSIFFFCFAVYQCICLMKMLNKVCTRWKKNGIYSNEHDELQRARMNKKKLNRLQKIIIEYIITKIFMGFMCTLHTLTCIYICMDWNMFWLPIVVASWMLLHIQLLLW